MSETAELGRKEMFREIKQLCAANNSTNWLVLVREYAIFGLTVTACIGWYRHVTISEWSLAWAVPVYVLAVLIIGVWTQNRLAVLIHESSHYSLFRNRFLNELASNWFVAFPLFAAINNYRAGHWGHHRHVNDPDHDPDLLRLKKHQPRDFPIGRGRFIWEYCMMQLMPHKAISYLKGRALYAMIPAKNQEAAKNVEALPKNLFRALRISYYLILCTVLTALGWWPYYVLLWLVPMVTFYPVVLFLREIAHHGNYPDNGDFTNSRVYGGKWLEREIFFPFGEWNHVLHHMFPTVPWYRTHEAHAVLMRYPPYRDNIVYCDGFFFKGDSQSPAPTVLDVLAKPSRAYLMGTESLGESSGIRHSTADEVGSIGELIQTHRGGES